MGLKDHLIRKSYSHVGQMLRTNDEVNFLIGINQCVFKKRVYCVDNFKKNLRYTVVLGYRESIEVQNKNTGEVKGKKNQQKI